jgi:AMP-binding enzyme
MSCATGRPAACTRSGWECVVAYHAALRLGAVVNPINVMLTPEEVAFVLNDCGAAAIFTAGEKAEVILGLTRTVPTVLGSIGFALPGLEARIAALDDASVTPGWIKARGMSFYLIVFQGGGAVGSAIMGRDRRACRTVADPDNRGRRAGSRPAGRTPLAVPPHPARDPAARRRLARAAASSTRPGPDSATSS